MLKWLAQVGVLALVLLFFRILGGEAAKNFARSDISFGFDWLGDPPGFSIREGIDLQPNSGIRALAVGGLNTLRVAFSGIIAATILGTIIGVARLSKNFIVNKLAGFYIETIRNVPLLLQMFFWQVLLMAQSSLTEGDVGSRIFSVSNKGVASIWVFPSTGFWPWFLIFLGGVYLSRKVARKRRTYQEDTGENGHPGLFGILTLLGIALVGWLVHPLLGFLSILWDGIGDLIGAIPAATVSLLIAGAAIVAAVVWIKRFLDSKRTPAGLGKLTDDDIFRMIFAGVSALFVVWIAFKVGGAVIAKPDGTDASVAAVLRDSFANIFYWFGDKFTGEAGSPLSVSKPAIELRGTGGFVQYADTGILATVPFFSVWIAVTLYTASFIAEIIRGGILAVAKGQTEASQALGLRRGQYLRLVILPQAFRIILPPLGNQYLNLAKNTSLGTAVAFGEIVAVGATLINQTGQSLPIVIVWMAFYLILSLSLSGVVNYYNRRMALVER
ncbi:putative glutamine ABC transporter permease protein GlnM [bacterium BMS3Bbin02]|nr:putative glutamine ABC transporter permease protein GlnM [bacterium BMS3Bbin02]